MKITVNIDGLCFKVSNEDNIGETSVTGQMAQCFSSRTALAEDLGTNPSTVCG